MFYTRRKAFWKNHFKENVNVLNYFRWEKYLNKLIFQGNIIDGSAIVWITDKIEGNVTYLGLYIGKFSGNNMSGI